MENFIRESGRGPVIDQRGDLLRRVAGLLFKLALHAIQEILALVEFSGGQLEGHLADGVAVLAHHDDVLLVQEGHDADGAGVVHELARGELAVGELDGVDAEIDRAAAPDRLFRDEFLDETGVSGGGFHWADYNKRGERDGPGSGGTISGSRSYTQRAPG